MVDVVAAHADAVKIPQILVGERDGVIVLPNALAVKVCVDSGQPNEAGDSCSQIII